MVRNQSKVYFTTSRPITMSEFVEIEVEERGNYPIEEVRKWMRKYNLNNQSLVVWVSPKRYVAWRYQMLAEDWDNIKKLKREAERNKDSITRIKGDIIYESNDGDDGYLLIVER